MSGLTSESSQNSPHERHGVLTPVWQWRLLARIGGGIVLVWMIVALLRALLTPPPPAVEVLPPDAFRPTAQQLAGLTIAPAAAADPSMILRATGAIAVDGDHATSILLPYSGQVTQVLVEAGQHVQRGQPLLVIASPEMVDARNALATTEAQVASARQAAENARLNAERQQAIHDSAGGALKDTLQSRADAAAAESAYEAAQSALRAARGHLALYGDAGEAAKGVDTVYRAPVSGVITDRSVSPGQFIAAGNAAPLMTIADISRVWLVAQLTESDAPLVRMGDDVTVTVTALPGKSFHARVTSVGAVIDPATHRVPVRADVDNPGGVLKPQMFANFAIRHPVGGWAGVTVPSAAVIHEGDAARVWVLGTDGLLHGRGVKTAEAEAGHTRIVGGLRAGDRVVTSGALFVNEAGLDQ